MPISEFFELSALKGACLTVFKILAISAFLKTWGSPALKSFIFFEVSVSKTSSFKSSLIHFAIGTPNPFFGNLLIFFGKYFLWIFLKIFFELLKLYLWLIGILAINSVKSLDIPIFFIVNKKDLYPKSDLDNINGKYVAKDFISTTNKLDIKRVIKKIVELLPEHPAYYSKDQLTDKNERFLVSEIVREEIFNNFSQEIPYSTHVEIISFRN